MICNKCGTKMRFEQDSHSICWVCDNCGDEVASTYFEPFETDFGDYHVLLAEPFKANTSVLKLISEIANCNYTEAKKKIEKAPVEIFCGKALRLKQSRKNSKQPALISKLSRNFPIPV